MKAYWFSSCVSWYVIMSMFTLHQVPKGSLISIFTFFLFAKVNIGIFSFLICMAIEFYLKLCSRSRDRSGGERPALSPLFNSWSVWLKTILKSREIFSSEITLTFLLYINSFLGHKTQAFLLHRDNFLEYKTQTFLLRVKRQDEWPAPRCWYNVTYNFSRNPWGK